MKKTLDIKKLILLNMPYILLGLFATNFGEAWRMAQGADASEKFLSLVAVLPGALQSFWPSLHPLDLLVGLCCGGIFFRYHVFVVLGIWRAGGRKDCKAVDQTEYCVYFAAANSFRLCAG